MALLQSLVLQKQRIQNQLPRKGRRNYLFRIAKLLWLGLVKFEEKRENHMIHNPRKDYDDKDVTEIPSSHLPIYLLI